jgi:ribosome-binding ATPase
MKLGIIGLPGAGKTTIFAALTGARGEDALQKGPRSDTRIGTIRVVDERIDFLTALFRPKKTTFAQVEYLLPSQTAGASSKSENLIWNQVRVCDALIHVVRNFSVQGGQEPASEADFWRLEEEMILSDLAVVEKKLERIELDSRRGLKPGEEEHGLIRACKAILEQGSPLRTNTEIATAPLLRGFTFLSAKPQLVIVNNHEEDEALPAWRNVPEKVDRAVIRGRIEMEIASMSAEEAEEFRTEYHIRESALDRVIKGSYELLHLLSFFTVLHDEVRAWTVPTGTPAIEAAGTVHTDMKKGFIRAEVVPFHQLKACGTYAEAKKAGQVRLEGKDYLVQDGDIIQFRFNV